MILFIARLIYDQLEFCLPPKRSRYLLKYVGEILSLYGVDFDQNRGFDSPLDDPVAVSVNQIHFLIQYLSIG